MNLVAPILATDSTFEDSLAPLARDPSTIPSAGGSADTAPYDKASARLTAPAGMHANFFRSVLQEGLAVTTPEDLAALTHRYEDLGDGIDTPVLPRECAHGSEVATSSEQEGVPG